MRGSSSVVNWGEWPGKSPSETGIEHPAAYHMLDVAAVAERLIAQFNFPERLRNALVLLVALHDLGKISVSFREMLRNRVPQDWKHWELTEALLYLHDDKLAVELGGKPATRRLLYASVAGHHGRPPARALGVLPVDRRRNVILQGAIRQVGEADHAAGRLVEEFCSLFPDASLDGLDPESDRLVALSWWLPGLCAAADWIGSNTIWFEPQHFGATLADYLNQARKQASVAVIAAGLGGGSILDNAALGDQFAYRPMQAACRDIVLPDKGPVLAIIEDETGSGKTEAALVLAHRLLKTGRGRGLYFALPTMATADAMFRRIAGSLHRIMANVSLALAHGRAGESEEFRALVRKSGDTETRTDEVGCSGWLAESRRRALLADVGVGTVDQALMAVLPVRHQALRHFGLSSKIIIVDEVHEVGEPYIAEELIALLRMHRAAGGSAILLTATLPLLLREKLLATYGGESASAAYPALTIAGGAKITTFPGEKRARRGAVTVRRCSSGDGAIQLIAEGVDRGAACAWIRNSVDDAIASAAELCRLGIDAKVLHARFALGDRKCLENEILARAGRDSEGERRKGLVVIGTQILESSLDLDFDLMISDIAPIAAIVQRAGRLWRHMDVRPAGSRPYPVPTLHILCPDPEKVTDANWLQDTLGLGAFVYPIADVWRSAKVLFRKGSIEAPDGVRELIEAVHGARPEALPVALHEAETRASGEMLGARALASHNIVDWQAGYRLAGGGDNDALYPTRLGEPQRTLVLCRQTPTGLASWIETDSEFGWSLSEVSASARRLGKVSLPDQSAVEIQTIKRQWPEWRREAQILCPVQDDGKICDGLRYSSKFGLIFDRNQYQAN